MDNNDTQGPKHTRQELLDAAQNGHLKIIQEFCTETYESSEKKRQLYYELIQVAKSAKQYEIVNILEPYYKTELKSASPSDIEKGSVVRLHEHYKQVLLGFLTGLSGIIADSLVVIDPADPNTYKELFSGLTASVAKLSKELQQINDEQDVKKLSEQDLDRCKGKLQRIDSELTTMRNSKDVLVADMQETITQLAAGKDLSAAQRKLLLEQKEAHQRQLAVYECSIFLYQHQKEAIVNRQKIVKFIRGNVNLFLFYRTIENLLQTLFHGVLAAQEGYAQLDASAGLGTASEHAIKFGTSCMPFSK
jgi:hypothetical protein